MDLLLWSINERLAGRDGADVEPLDIGELLEDSSILLQYESKTLEDHMEGLNENAHRSRPPNQRHQQAAGQADRSPLQP